MAIWDFIRGEFIDIIEWIDNSSDTMVWRFPRQDNEIKNGAKLIVRESQVAVFFNEGQFADVYQAGTHTLYTENMPILSKLKGWKHGFESPFKAEVYFVSTKIFTNRKWGTKNPIMMRDAEFGAVRIRAFGSYSLKVFEPLTFMREIVGTDGKFTSDEITEQLRNLVVSRFTDAVAESKIPVLDMAANYDEFAYKIKDRMILDFNAYGLELTQLIIENISLPPEVEAMLDKKTSMGILGNLDNYAKFQAANAIEEAAKNPNSGMGQGIGIGAGIGMANQMANQFGQTQNPQQPQNTPPPPPPQVLFHVSVNGQQQGPFDLPTLQQMAQNGQLTRQSYVWKQGMAAWASAENVPETANLFMNMPPPLPPI